jgi:hypothetical protein
MRTAFSALFWTYLALGCIPLFLGAVLVWLVTLPFDRKGRILHLYSCLWAQLFFWSNPFWRLRVEGRQHLDRCRFRKGRRGDDRHPVQSGGCEIHQDHADCDRRRRAGVVDSAAASLSAAEGGGYEVKGRGTGNKGQRLRPEQ